MKFSKFYESLMMGKIYGNFGGRYGEGNNRYIHWIQLQESPCQLKRSVRPSFLPCVTKTKYKKLCEAHPREEGHVSALTL